MLRAPPLRTVLLSLAIAALLAVAGVLAWNTRPTGDRARAEASAKLQALNELDARWDIATLAAKTDPAQLTQADTLLVPAIQRALEEVQGLAAATGSPALSTGLPGLKAAFADKIALGEQTSRDARSLGMALEKALAETAALAAGMRADAGQGDARARERAAAQVRSIEMAAAELLAFWGSSGDGRRLAADAAIATVSSMPAPAEPGALRTSALAVLDGKPGLEARMTRFSLSPAGPRLSALTSAFSAEVQSGIERQQLFRTYLLFYSAALLVLLAWIGSRLAASYRVIARINDALTVSNENLEHKVELRTRELSDALAELKESEAQLIQSEKMSSLGQMVAGIAHEINTPVAYVKNSLGSVDTRLDSITRLTSECETLLSMLEAGDTTDTALDMQLGQLSAAARALGGSSAVGELGGLVKDGLYGVDQIGQIVTHLRDFSRLDRGTVQQFDLHQGIESTLLLARHMLKGIRIEKKFGTDGTLNGSPSQINQVLLNLITNAAQAMGAGGGLITIATSGNSGQLVLEISDTGPGIPPDVLPKIFDPFFTTKAVGQGTGLGLSISYKIVAQHGGRIDVNTLAGKGTTFRIQLPRSGHAPEVPGSNASSAGPAAGAAPGATLSRARPDQTIAPSAGGSLQGSPR